MFRTERKIPLLSKYRILHETYGLSVFLDSYISMANTEFHMKLMG